MKPEITELLLKDKARFRAKGLFTGPDDSLSMRIPGREEFLLAFPRSEEIHTVSFSDTTDGAAGLHASIFRERSDVGAVLVGQTAWSAALSRLKNTMPILFDEQARHIGKLASAVAPGDTAGLKGAFSGGANIAIYGEQRICLGVTPDRVVFNAELFEKCAKAYVIAFSSARRIRNIPGWVCYIAGGRLRKDQKRAAESYAAGKIPEGMNAY